MALKDYFLKMLKYEKDYQKLKIELQKLRGFDTVKVFNSFDLQNKGFIDRRQLKMFMGSHGLLLTDIEIRSFFDRFWIFGAANGRFRQKQFDMMIKPVNLFL